MDRLNYLKEGTLDMEKVKLCLGCMEILGDNDRVCHHCGYSNNSTYDDYVYIVPGTVLSNQRYTIGRLLRSNGESALYIAYDNNMGCKVTIREYMPIGLCTRDKTSSNIIIGDKCCVQYKSLMAEFTELNRSLVKLRNLGNITQVLDLFHENNTSYAVYEYTEGITLSQYLKDNMGELTWDETSKIFPQLLTTVGLLHQSGIIHRAISPETIYYTNRGELMLTDFSISAVRTKDTELTAELYKGYSAPEQYTVSGKQGTWTDVYGISAVMYKLLTGCMPTEAINRSENNPLCPPIEINSDIPESVSNAIMDGLSINIDNRIQTVTDLVTKLFQSNGNSKRENFSSTIQIPRRMLDEQSGNYPKNEPTPSTERPVKEEEVERGEKGSLFDRIKFPLMIGILLLTIIFILGWVFINMFSTTPTDTTTNSLLEHHNGFIEDDQFDENGDIIEVTTTNNSKTVTYIMKNLIDQDIADVKLDSEIQDKLRFEVSYEYNDEYDKDKVFEQSIAVGERYQEGDTIKLKISKGPKSAEVPDYKTSDMSTYTKDEYIKLLESKGIPYQLIAVANKSSKDGYIISTEPKAGETINIARGEVLEVTYADNQSSNKDDTTKVTTYSVKSTTVATTEKKTTTTSESKTSKTTTTYEEEEEEEEKTEKSKTTTYEKSYDDDDDDDNYKTTKSTTKTTTKTTTKYSESEDYNSKVTEAPSNNHSSSDNDYSNDGDDEEQE